MDLFEKSSPVQIGNSEGSRFFVASARCASRWADELEPSDPSANLAKPNTATIIENADADIATTNRILFIFPSL